MSSFFIFEAGIRMMLGSVTIHMNQLSFTCSNNQKHLTPLVAVLLNPGTEKNAANTENKRRAKQSEHSCEQFVQNALYAYYIYSPRPPSLLLSMHKNTHMPPLIATDELLVDPFFESLRDCTRGFRMAKCKLHTASASSRSLCSQVCIS